MKRAATAAFTAAALLLYAAPAQAIKCEDVFSKIDQADALAPFVVGDSVTRSVFPLDENGFLSPLSGRSFFTVIENRLP